MDLQRSARTLPKMSLSIIKSQNKTTRGCRLSQANIYLKTRQTIRIFKIQIITLKTNIQISVCVLALFKCILFLMLIMMNIIVIFPNVEPNNAETAKCTLQIINLPVSELNNTIQDVTLIWIANQLTLFTDYPVTCVCWYMLMTGLYCVYDKWNISVAHAAINYVMMATLKHSK